MFKLVSLNIALPEKINLNGGSKKHLTAFFKKRVDGKIFLDELGFHGDGVGDSRIHGGKDLAICAYFVDHFPYWQAELDKEMNPGSFGENLSLSGITEKQINIGDIFRLGEAEIEVSQPRQPCHKLNKVFDLQEMACKVQKTGYTGCYFRVKKTGWVEPNSVFKRIQEGLEKISVEMVNVLMFKEKKNPDLLKKVVSLQELSEEWRKKFRKRI
jgi:MOSC domain-containing protein YiiM